MKYFNAKTLIFGGIIILSFLIFIVSLFFPKNNSGPSAKPNIILIIIETLRADHLSCYGYSELTSPNIDKLAEEAMLYKHCYSHAPITSSSVASILSGLLPHQTKTFENNPLPQNVKTVSEILRENGYTTGAVICNYNLRRGTGFEKGFDEYNSEMLDSELVREIPERVADKATDAAIEWLKRHYKRNFFLWIHYQDPHGPYTPPPPFNTLFFKKGQKKKNLKLNPGLSGDGGIPSYQQLEDNRNYYFYVSRYDGEIRYLDKYFGYLIKTLKDLGVYENSLIILTADHGEGLGEHNYYFAHGEHLYNSLLHVPLIIKWKTLAPGYTDDCVQHLDLLPTILDICDISIDILLQGRNLLNKNKIKKEIFAEMSDKGNYSYSVTKDYIKLMYEGDKYKYSLFNLKNDPDEKNNLIKNSAYRVYLDLLKKRLHYIKKKTEQAHKSIRRLEYTAEERERLKSLGYAQ